MLQKSTPIELKHVFNKNDYATTSEWIRFNFQKKLTNKNIFNLQKKGQLFKSIQPLKKPSLFKKYLKYHSLKYTRLSHITDIQPIKTIRYIEPIKSI